MKRDCLVRFWKSLAMMVLVCIGFSPLTPPTATAAPIIYVTDVNHGSVSTVSSTGVVTTFKSGLGGLPGGLDFDDQGNLYVMNFGNPATIQKSLLVARSPHLLRGSARLHPVD